MQTKMQDLMRKQKGFSVRTRYPEAIKTSIPEKGFQDKRKTTHQRMRAPENRLPMVPLIKPGKPRRVDFQANRSASSLNRVDAAKAISSHRDGIAVRTTCDKRKISSIALQRSKSDVVKRVVIDESRNIVRRIETEQYEPPEIESDEERDEYACLSNEELNRRVEDFIDRFNLQIRLQAKS